MWSVRNYTPYKAKHSWSRDKSGVHQWIVCVKATFDINVSGDLHLSDEQLDPLLLPEFNGQAYASSLRYNSDIVSLKPTTDVVINGTAYAPMGRPTTEFLVSMRVARIHKVIQVVGERIWEHGWMGATPSSVEPVTHLPVIYERAYGGHDQVGLEPKDQRLDTRNPVGRGVAVAAHRLYGKPLPNFQYPNRSIENASPAGFGAIDSHWSPRRELSGSYDTAWERRRRPLLPEDWDARSLLCSPPDQQPPTYLQGGEPIELVNLTPNGRLQFSLPKIYLRFTTRIDGRTEEHRGRLVTVIIEPDRKRTILVWVSTLACHSNIDYLDETKVREKRYLG